MPGAARLIPAAIVLALKILGLPSPVGASPHGPADHAARFGPCGDSARESCVIDGDTFWYRGEKIRIADINTPETGNPLCLGEAALGRRARERLTDLLNAGPFRLEPTSRARDKYGRLLRIVSRNGQSLGSILVDEGLAEEWRGRRRNWC